MVIGSNPISGSIFYKRFERFFFLFFLLIGQIPERSNGGDCKSLVYDFGGSNPSLPTILK